MDLRPADEVAGDEVRGSPESVRADLETMRDEVLAPNFPDIPMEQNILRPELLEVLLRARPVTREEWLRRIPLDLRIDTAPEHMVLLDDILDIVSRNSD